MITYKQLLFRISRICKITAALVFLLCCSCHSSDELLATNLPSDLKEAHENGKASGLNIVDFNGIRFIFDDSLQTEVIPEVSKAVLLENKNDKPDSVSPTHIVFHFRGEYGKEHENSSFFPELHIYPIEQYKQSLLNSETESKRFEMEISNLRTMLLQKPLISEKDIPFAKFIDGEQLFHSHLKYTSFHSGNGVWFLAQYDMEPSLINNRGLTYIFQGISSDNKYYVLGTFPVALSFLPKDFDTSTFENYDLPLTFYTDDSEEVLKNEKEYEKYLNNIREKIKNTPAERFQPSLLTLREIISSLDLHDPHI